MRFHQYEFDSWSIDAGLPQVTVHAVIQGPDHYIWAATQSGLARFDGARFHTFTPTSHPNLPSLLVRALHVDRAQRLWIGSLRGAALWHKGELRRVPTETGRAVDVRAIVQGSNGEVLLATGGGLWVSRGDLLRQVPGSAELSLNAVLHRDGATWVGGRDGVLRHSDDGWKREALPQSGEGAVVTALAWHDGTMWAGSSRGLFYRTDRGWQALATREAAVGRSVETLFADRAGTLWVGASGLLFRLQGREIVDVIGKDGPFPDGNVMSMSEDHEGNLWIGSRSYGLARVWGGYALRYGAPEGLHAELTWALAPDRDGTLWVGTADGLVRFSDRQFERVVAGSEQPHPHAYSLLPEPDRVWVGTRAGLYWWQRDKARMFSPPAFQALAGEQVHAILRRADGTYWLGTSGGIWRWDGESLSRELSASESSANHTWVLLETRDRRLLAGTVGGILVYRPGEGFQPLADPLGIEEVMTLLELDDGRLVAGSRSERLLISSEDGWRSLGEADGVPANTGFALEQFRDQLWVAGNRGLYRVELAKLDAYLAGERSDVGADMLLSERGDVPGAQNTTCCNGAGTARSALLRGQLWFPTREGIIAVRPGDTRRNAVPPRLHIDRVRLDGAWQALYQPDSLQLAQTQRDIAFGFTALSYQDPGSVRLEYRLLGYQDQWQAVDDSLHRIAFFTNLPAGQFVFQVRGSNNAGVWAAQGAELPVYIKPYWYETLSFQILCALAGLLVIWLAVLWRTRSLTRQRQRLKQLVATRTEELRVANQHLQQYSRELETTSRTDPLTGLWNRRYFSEEVLPQLLRFQQEQAAGLHEGQRMLLALIDIDHFKRFNDLYGHEAGDHVLCQLAEWLQSVAHPRDHVLRWGGEEFLVVFQALPETQSSALADRILRSLRGHQFRIDGDQGPRLSVSMGLVPWPMGATPLDETQGRLACELALELADKGLYQAKRTGRDNWCLVEVRAEVAALAQAAGDDLETLVERGLVVVHRGRREE